MLVNEREDTMGGVRGSWREKEGEKGERENVSPSDTNNHEDGKEEQEEAEKKQRKTKHGFVSVAYIYVCIIHGAMGPPMMSYRIDR